MALQGTTLKRGLIFFAFLNSLFVNGRQTEVYHNGPSLEEVVNRALPGDTLCVNSGMYPLKSELMITRPLSIIGCGDVVLVAADKHGAIEIRSHHARVEGLRIIGVNRSYLEDLAAIWVDDVRDFVIQNNRIDSCFFGVFCTKASSGIIRGNQIVGNAVVEAQSANAIHLWYCDSLLIELNEVRNHRDGIYLEFTNYSTIRGNFSSDQLRYGLHFMYSHYDTYTQNTFTRNGAGVAVMFSNFIHMNRNLFEDNWGPASYGLLLKEIRDSEIANNRFLENTTGIFMEGCSRVFVSRNEFESNGWALKIRGSSDDNDFEENRFDRNSFDVASESRQNPNRFFRNYWGDYHGYDLDRDGIGDVPHRPMSLFSHMTTRWEESILLMRSSFMETLNFVESVSPSLTPSDLEDPFPLMKPASTGIHGQMKLAEK